MMHQNQENLRIIQKKGIGILKEFIRVCQNHDLTYFIISGTLLGAVRHGGFIPWDDDIDIGMPRSDYDRLASLFQDEFEFPYKLVTHENTPSHTKAFMNVQDKTTKIVFTYGHEKTETSVWLDIFPIDGMPGKGFKRFIHEKRYLVNRMLVQLSQFKKIVNQNKKNRPLIERAIIGLANRINLESMINYERAQARYIKTLKKYDMTEENAGTLPGIYKLGELVRSDVFGTGVVLDFEGIPVNAPEKYHEFLVSFYGEKYMEMPPKDKIVYHQFDIIDLGQ